MVDKSMPEKDPTTYSMLTYAWVVGLSMWGGVVNTLARVKSGGEKFSILILFADISVAAFAGVITFWLTQAANIDQLLSAAMVGISGHMGAKIIRFFEGGIQNWASSFGRSFSAEASKDNAKCSDTKNEDR